MKTSQEPKAEEPEKRGRGRRSVHSKDFIAAAVERALEGVVPIRHVALDLGVSPQTLYNWVYQTRNRLRFF